MKVQEEWNYGEWLLPHPTTSSAHQIHRQTGCAQQGALRLFCVAMWVQGNIIHIEKKCDKKHQKQPLTREFPSMYTQNSVKFKVSEISMKK